MSDPIENEYTTKGKRTVKGGESFKGRRNLTSKGKKNEEKLEGIRKDTNKKYADMSSGKTESTGTLSTSDPLYNKMKSAGEVQTDTGEYFGVEGTDWTEDKNGNVVTSDGKVQGPRYSTMMNDVEVTADGVQNINKSNFGSEVGNVAGMLAGAPAAAVGEFVSGDHNYGNLNSSQTQMNVADRYGMGTRGADGRMYGDNMWQKGVNGAIGLASDPLSYLGVGAAANIGKGAAIQGAKQVAKQGIKRLPGIIYKGGKKLVTEAVDDAGRIVAENTRRVGNAKSAVKGAIANPKAAVTGAKNAVVTGAKNKVANVVNAPANMVQRGKDAVATVKGATRQGVVDSAKTNIKHAASIKNMGHTAHQAGNAASKGFVADATLNDGKVGAWWDHAKNSEYMDNMAGEGIKRVVDYGKTKADMITNIGTGHIKEGINNYIGVKAHDIVGGAAGKLFKGVTGNVLGSAKSYATNAVNDFAHHYVPSNGGAHHRRGGILYKIK